LERRTFLINGLLLNEPYISSPTGKLPGEESHRLDLGPGEYFVAGDNRLYSRDSRTYGPIWRSDILGELI